MDALERSWSELQSDKAFNETIIDHVPLGILGLNEAGEVTRCNAALVEILGCGSKEEIVGRNLRQISGFKEIELPEGLSSDQRSSPKPDAMETSLKAPDGRMKRILIWSVPLTDQEKRRVGGRVILLEDITDRAQMERQLIQSEKMASLGQLVAGVAHDLRNPLSTIGWAVYGLGRLPDSTKEVCRYLEKIRSNLERSNQIISNLLNFSRPAPENNLGVKIPDILEEVLLLVSKNIHSRNIQVVRAFQETPAVSINPDAARQMFLNLIVNAVQAMPDGGSLRLEVWKRTEEEIEVIISDTGAGIKRQDLSNIFNPFFTTKGPREGTGLGLFLVRREVEKCSGRIRVKSTEEEGTTFSIDLPVQPHRRHHGKKVPSSPSGR